MHNKSFIVDNQVAVVGGRNVGDEYFGAGAGVRVRRPRRRRRGDGGPRGFGRVRRLLEQRFDVPGGGLRRPRRAGAAAGLGPLRVDPWRPAVGALPGALLTAPLVREISTARSRSSGRRLAWVYDDRRDARHPRPHRRAAVPGSSFAPWAGPSGRSTSSLRIRARQRRHGGRSWPVGRARRPVRILTNSLASSDVAAVQRRLREAARRPAPRRRPALRAPADRRPDGQGEKLWHRLELVIRPARQDLRGRRGAHLRRSFNFDQRSARLNTEMGIVVDSPASGRACRSLRHGNTAAAWEVRLASTARASNGSNARQPVSCATASEPATTWIQRSGVQFLSVLPIDGLL